jgi:CRP/FNR family transcriptional regulator, anaerobic regulatory protein
MFPVLLTHIRRFVQLSDEEAALLLTLVQYKEVKKKEYLLNYGQVCTANYFIAKGCLRLFVINEKGNEQIVQFGIENWWMTDYDSFEDQKPSRFYIQAVEDAELIKLGKKERDELIDKVPKMERYFRIILQKAYTASQRRLQYIFSISGEERYYQFSEAFPGFVQRIPQYMLASYLGLTPEFISKIRAKKKK